MLSFNFVYAKLDGLRNTSLRHGDAVQTIADLHRASAVRNQNELRTVRKLLYVFAEALISNHCVTNEIVTERPLGEQNNIVLSRLLDLWKICQNAEKPYWCPLDLQWLFCR